MGGMRGVVIGGGAVGSDFHAPRLLDIAGCSSVTIVDTQAAQRDRLQRKFAGNDAVSVAAALPETEFELAVVATPPKYHLPCFSDLEGRARQVIIEKPLARTLAEAQELVTLATKWQVQTYVGLIRRSLQGMALVKHWIDSGLYGELQSVQVAEGMIFSWNAVSVGSFSRDMNGGGVLMDTGPHTIDQLFQVFDRLELQSAKLDALPRENSAAIEANATIRLLANGTTPVTLVLSRNRSLSNTAVFEFEKATVTASLHSNHIELADRDGKGITGLPNSESRDVDYPQLFDAYYRRFIREGYNQGLSAEDSLPLHALLDDIYTAAGQIESVF